MPEWSIGAVSKTVIPSGIQGSNPCLSAEKTCKKLSLNLVGFFVPKKLHQKCTNPVSTHFYGHFSNCTYPIHPIPLSPSTRQHKMRGVIFLPFQSKRCTNKGNHPCSSLLKMAFHKHSPLLISDSEIWSCRSNPSAIHTIQSCCLHGSSLILIFLQVFGSFVPAQSAHIGIQLSMFQLEDPVLIQIRDQIRDLNINNLTPLEALNTLNEIKKITGL